MVAPAQAAGFYAVAYTMGSGGGVPPELRGKSVISCRGTDDMSVLGELGDDPLISYTGRHRQKQFLLATRFANTVRSGASDPKLLLTGHSLGGGLAA